MIQTKMLWLYDKDEVDMALWYRKPCCDFLIETKLIWLYGTIKIVVTLWYRPSWYGFMIQNRLWWFMVKTKLIWLYDTGKVKAVLALRYRRSCCGFKVLTKLIWLDNSDVACLSCFRYFVRFSESFGFIHLNALKKFARWPPFYFL